MLCVISRRTPAESTPCNTILLLGVRSGDIIIPGSVALMWLYSPTCSSIAGAISDDFREIIILRDEFCARNSKKQLIIQTL